MLAGLAVLDVTTTGRKSGQRRTSHQETDEIFALASRFYPGYLNYRQRVGGSRRIRAFVLEPA